MEDTVLFWSFVAFGVIVFIVICLFVYMILSSASDCEELDEICHSHSMGEWKK